VDAVDADVDEDEEEGCDELPQPVRNMAALRAATVVTASNGDLIAAPFSEEL
jgi:hypothetical protein